jgi:hypothetical protein
MNDSHNLELRNYNQTVEFVYGRPQMYIILFFLSIMAMVIVIILSYPIDNKKKVLKACSYMGSIWIAQEGVIFLQGHRPLEFTLYDATISLISIPFILMVIQSKLREYRNKTDERI